jgi:lysophospholipase L1-like esterase
MDDRTFVGRQLEPNVTRSRWVRLLWIVLAGFSLIAVALAYLFFRYYLPVGDGPAGPHVPREAFLKPWTSRKVLLVGIGDSVTAGYGVQPAYSYFARLANNPPDEFSDMQGICLATVLPSLQTKNIAVSGSTSLAHVGWIHEKLETQPADTFGLIVMTSGGNDLIHDYGRSKPREDAMYGATLEEAQPWIEGFAGRLSQMIAALKSKFPGGCMIFIADIYDPTDGLGDASRVGLPSWPDGVAIHRKYNEMIQRCADTDPAVHVVPMRAAFLGHGIHCTQPWHGFYHFSDPHYWYAENLEDPNVRGYDAIRRLFLIEIAKQAASVAEKP